MENPKSPNTDSVEILIDESVAMSAVEYREIPYLAITQVDEDIDEGDGGGEPPQERAVDIRAILAQCMREQESTRTGFTRGLFLIFASVVGFALVASLTPYWSNAKDALLIVLPAVTGFVGFAVGFYYLTIFGSPKA